MTYRIHSARKAMRDYMNAPDPYWQQWLMQLWAKEAVEKNQ